MELARLTRWECSREVVMELRRGIRRWAALWSPGLVVLAVGILVANAALAQDLQPINEVSEYIQGFMTGRLATSLAVIAVAVVGYLFWAGQVAARSALSVVVGIAIVFGSVQIV